MATTLCHSCSTLVGGGGGGGGCVAGVPQGGRLVMQGNDIHVSCPVDCAFNIMLVSSRSTVMASVVPGDIQQHDTPLDFSQPLYACVQ